MQRHEVVASVGSRTEHDVGRIQCVQGAVDGVRVHRGGVRADHYDPIRDLKCTIEHLFHPPAEVAVRLRPVPPRWVSQPGPDILLGTARGIAHRNVDPRIRKLVDHHAAHAPVDVGRGLASHPRCQPGLHRPGSRGFRKHQYQCAAVVVAARCDGPGWTRFPARRVSGRQPGRCRTPQKPRDQGDVTNQSPDPALLFVATGAGGDGGGERLQSFRVEEALIQDHVLHDRLIGIGTNVKQQLPRKEQTLITVHEAGAADPDALRSLDQAVVEVGVGNGEAEVRCVAAVLPDVFLDRLQGGTVQAGVGVKHEQPGRPEKNRARVHLPRASGPAPQHRGPAFARRSHRAVARASVDHQHFGAEFERRKVLQQMGERLGLVDRGDDDPQSRTAAGGSRPVRHYREVSFSVQS